MIETKIETLTSAIERLIAALDRTAALRETADAAPKVKAKSKAEKLNAEPTAKTTTVDAEPETAPEPKKGNVDAPRPRSNHLQAKCLELVRADRANKALIVDLIGQHSDGGKLIKDIPDDSLEAFAKALGAL